MRAIVPVCFLSLVLSAGCRPQQPATAVVPESAPAEGGAAAGGESGGGGRPVISDRIEVTWVDAAEGEVIDGLRFATTARAAEGEFDGKILWEMNLKSDGADRPHEFAGNLDGFRVSDRFGKSYPVVSTSGFEQGSPKTIGTGPGDGLTLSVVTEPPTERAEELYVELPGDLVDVPGVYRLKMPRSGIKNLGAEG